MADFSLLRKMFMFRDLSDESLIKVCSIWHERMYKKGKIIFMEGEPGYAFYYVISGKVKIYNTASDGREHIIHIFGDGNVFGEVTILNNIAYPATAEVLEDSRIGMIKNDELELLMKEDGSLAFELIKVLCRRLHMASIEIRNLAFKDTLQRTAISLLKLSQSHGVKTSRGIELNIDITRQELADVAGTTRESVTRALSKLKKDKIIDMGDTIIIKDVDQLIKWIDN
ncbi:cAMP receptor protein [Oxobacter pfennigii]|uniref:cAMP receptor protein n=1 Tax=Oxobacter pfennigii TaxID=36849 RepID=A0A0P8X5I2_9CLOT|nr:Crp/Fnr family transcriptional regulator [Oxobacter pfennigii]KPU46084.1 cAMP receptor protein [Oxobacter pfennigii]